MNSTSGRTHTLSSRYENSSELTAMHDDPQSLQKLCCVFALNNPLLNMATQALPCSIINVLMDVATSLIYDPVIPSTLTPFQFIIRSWPHKSFNMSLVKRRGGNGNSKLSEVSLQQFVDNFRLRALQQPMCGKLRELHINSGNMLSRLRLFITVSLEAGID